MQQLFNIHAWFRRYTHTQRNNPRAKEINTVNMARKQQGETMSISFRVKIYRWRAAVLNFSRLKNQKQTCQKSNNEQMTSDNEASVDHYSRNLTTDGEWLCSTCAVNLWTRIISHYDPNLKSSCALGQGSAGTTEEEGKKGRVEMKRKREAGRQCSSLSGAFDPSHCSALQLQSRVETREQREWKSNTHGHRLKALRTSCLLDSLVLYHWALQKHHTHTDTHTDSIRMLWLFPDMTSPLSACVCVSF